MKTSKIMIISACVIMVTAILAVFSLTAIAMIKEIEIATLKETVAAILGFGTLISVFLLIFAGSVD